MVGIYVKATSSSLKLFIATFCGVYICIYVDICINLLGLLHLYIIHIFIYIYNICIYIIFYFINK